MGKQLNKKIILGVAALLSVIACIAVSSFVPFNFSLEYITSNKFITNELIIVAIVITTMVSTIFIGQASNAQNEKSKLAKARVNFFHTVSQITDLNKFFQWIKQVLQPSDIKSIYERKMREAGIEDFSVVDLEVYEIDQLLNRPQKFKEKYYKGLSHEQIKLIKKIKNGGYKITLVDPTYYITAKNLGGNKTISERSSSESLKKGSYLSFSIISKVVMTIFVGVIFGSLVKDTITGQDIEESLLTFASRIMSMISSAFMGYIVGCQINDIDAEYIEMRSIVHNEFLQDNGFVAKSTEELAKEEFIKREKNEEKGEVVDTPPVFENVDSIAQIDFSQNVNKGA